MLPITHILYIFLFYCLGCTTTDNPDASSLEYSPPASPVNGRYRNLGPELAATIPKRTVRNSWIAEVKQR